MIVNMSEKATEQEIAHVIERIREAGYQPHVTRGVERTIVAAVGNGRRHEIEALLVAPGVENVVPIAQPFKLVSRQVKPERSVVHVGEVRIGGDAVVIIAGPCSVESPEQLLSTAHAVKRAGATMLRGGAYKPRTSPYDFQGLGLEALKILREAREQTGLPVVTEVMSTEDIDVICDYVDMLQVGARNMQNFALLRRLASVKKPVLLKRGPSSTVKEWLLAAEYLLSGGNDQVVLCERGIKTFETEMRNTFRSGCGGSGARSIASAGDGGPIPRNWQAELDRGSFARGGCRGGRRSNHRSASVSGAGTLRRRTISGLCGL